MAKKKKPLFVCNSCGEDYLKWQGKCDNCGEWDSIKELRQYKSTSSISSKSINVHSAIKPVKLAECSIKDIERVSTGLKEVDRVLGGGTVPGSMVLVGGNPGIGKSTLMLHVAANMDSSGKNILYVSGEESMEQLALRSKRLKVSQAQIQLITETSIDMIMATIDDIKPDLVILDSIQTVFSPDVESAPGSVNQVRECTSILLKYIKESGTTLFIIGHVTKDGAIAGPRLLEHMVDTVLYFEGDSNFQHRILRAVKNRFGPSDEIAILSMMDDGLKEVNNASSFFLAHRGESQIGCAVVPVREGSRILVMELQALVNASHFGMPQRVASGINPKKLALIVAVLERYAGIELGDHDIFFNITGGLSVSEPAIDTALAASLISSFQNRTLRNRLGFIGEIGLGGEIREVNSMEQRIKELESLGFMECIVPVAGKNSRWKNVAKKIKLVECKDVKSLEYYIF